MRVRTLSFLEQGFVSGGNFLLLLILARMLPTKEWGIYSMGYALFLFAQGFQRAFVILPFVTLTPTHETLNETWRYWRKSQWGVTLLSIALLLFSGYIANAFGVGWLATALIVAACLILPYFFHEYARRLLLQRQFVGKAAVLAALLSSVMLTTVVAATGLSLSAIHTAILLFGVGGVVMLIATFVIESTCVTKSSCANKPQGAVRFGRWSALGHTAYAGYTTTIQLMLGFLGGVGELAAFSAIRNLVQPINVLIGAVDNLDKPRAVRAFHSEGVNGLWRVLKHTLLVLLAIGLTYLVVISAAGSWVVDALYAGKYDAGNGVIFWSLVALIMLVAQPLETGLYVMKRPDLIFVNRCVSSLVAIPCALLLIPAFGMEGAIFSMTLGWLTSTLLAGRHLHRTLGPR